MRPGKCKGIKEPSEVGSGLGPLIAIFQFVISKFLYLPYFVSNFCQYSVLVIEAGGTSTTHFDLVRLDFGLGSTKSKLALIKHNLGPDYVQLMF